MTGIELIAKERQEQIEKHGFTLDHDFYHETSENIIGAAIGAITADMGKFPVNWEDHLVYKIVSKPYCERLVIAGALLAAEIDRQNYISQTAG